MKWLLTCVRTLIGIRTKPDYSNTSEEQFCFWPYRTIIRNTVPTLITMKWPITFVRALIGIKTNPHHGNASEVQFRFWSYRAVEKNTVPKLITTKWPITFVRALIGWANCKHPQEYRSTICTFVNSLHESYSFRWCDRWLAVQMRTWARRHINWRLSAKVSFIESITLPPNKWRGKECEGMWRTPSPPKHWWVFNQSQAQTDCADWRSQHRVEGQVNRLSYSCWWLQSSSGR